MMIVPYVLMAGLGTLAWRQYRRKLLIEERGGWVEGVAVHPEAK